MTFIPQYALGAEPPSSDLIDPSNFNDTRFPGVIYATNPATHSTFMDLQNQLNRGAAVKKVATRLALDGKLGADTLALAQIVSLNTYAVSSLRNLAMNARIVALAAKAKADAAGISAKPSAPKPPSPPMIFNAQTNALVPAPAASIVDVFKNMGTTSMLLIAAAILGGAYFVTRGGSKASSPGKPSVRYRTRTRTKYIRRYRRSR